MDAFVGEDTRRSHRGGTRAHSRLRKTIGWPCRRSKKRGIGHDPQGAHSGVRIHRAGVDRAGLYRADWTRRTSRRISDRCRRGFWWNGGDGSDGTGRRHRPCGACGACGRDGYGRRRRRLDSRGVSLTLPRLQRRGQSVSEQRPLHRVPDEREHRRVNKRGPLPVRRAATVTRSTRWRSVLGAWSARSPAAS